MKPAFLFALFLLWLGPSAAHCDTKLSKEDLQCIFRKPLEMGASVTARVAEKIPFYSTLEYYLFGIRDPGYQGSPSAYFISHYRRQDSEEFSKYQYRRDGKNHVESTAIALTNRVDHTGTGQIEHLLDGDHKDLFEKSSILIGVDLFYWDAIHGLCGRNGSDRYLPFVKRGVGLVGKWTSVQSQLERFTEMAKKKNKVLVLGNVPKEDPEKVIINSRATGIAGWWYPQDQSCVDLINETLEKYCLVKNKCYIVDMKGLASDLDSGKKIFVKKEGRDIGLYEARPDGVHLSRLGSQGVAERMIELLETNPPRCAKVTEEDRLEEGKDSSSAQ